MWESLRTATSLMALLTLVTGVIYPCAITGIAQTVFAYQANGSLIRLGDEVVGSELIGQPFHDPGYFWGRLSATASYPNNAEASGGSNFGPLHPQRRALAVERLARLRGPEDAVTPVSSPRVPIDLVTASGSGLDPHISPASALIQVPRVALARSISTSELQQLVSAHTTARQWGFLGETRVNVLQLNLALDRLAGSRLTKDAP